MKQVWIQLKWTWSFGATAATLLLVMPHLETSIGPIYVSIQVILG